MSKLSIIIPIYNAEKYLQQCLQTVISDNPDLEYILIDDGSTDNSAKIYNQYKNHHNVIIKRTKNRGVSHARNLGISLSSSKYLMFVDADDYLIPNWYTKIKPYLTGNHDLVIFSTNYDDQAYDKLELIKACLGLSSTNLNRCDIMTPTSRLYKTAFLKKHHIQFPHGVINGEDLLFNLTCILQSDNIIIRKAGIYFYRANPSSSTSTFNETLIQSDQQFHTTAKALIDNSPYAQQLSYAINLSIANGLYLILNALVTSNYNHPIPLIRDLLSNYNADDLLKTLKSHPKNFNKFQYITMKLILCGKIRLAILVLKIKNIIKQNQLGSGGGGGKGYIR